MLAVAPLTALSYAPQLPVVSTVSRTTSPAMQEKSPAIPFLKKPPALDGSMPGDIGFDPLQISDLVPLQWSREAELKHARVCMLAVAGWVAVDAGFRVPFAPKVLSLYAHDACVEKGPMLGLFGLIAVVEVIAGIPKCFQLLNDPDAAPGGDYKFDPLGFGGGKELEEKELANGRLAMMAFSGIVTQATLTGGGWPYTYNGAADMVPPLAMTSMPGFGS